MLKRGDILHYDVFNKDYEVLEYDPRRDQYRVIRFDPTNYLVLVLEGYFVRTRMIKVQKIKTWYNVYETC